MDDKKDDSNRFEPLRQIPYKYVLEGVRPYKVTTEKPDYGWIRKNPAIKGYGVVKETVLA
jgi:hypothetical protein